MANKKKTKKNANKKNLSKNSRKIETIENDNSIKSTITLVIIILAILALFYFLTVFILNKKSNTMVTGNSSIQYTKIIAGESFNQNEDDYLVFYYDATSSDATNYADLISSYREKDKHLTIYSVDLNEGINKKYLSSTEENKDASKATELKIKGPTIIHFKNKGISDYITSSFSEYLDNNVE